MKKDTDSLGLFLPKPLPSADEPHDTPVVTERRFEIVPADLPEEDVLVEPFGDGRFMVTTLRRRGTTSCAVLYTRAQLEMLLRRVPAALEVG